MKALLEKSWGAFILYIVSMKKHFLSFIFLFLICPLYTFPQEVNIDSLKILLKDELHDSTRADIMLHISESSDIDSVFRKYNLLALEIAEKNIPNASGTELKTFLRIKASAFNNIGFDETTKGNLTSALNYYVKSLKIEREIKNNLDEAYILNNIADIYETQGNISAALKYYEESMKIHEKMNNPRGIAQAYNNLGFIYSNQGDLEKALDYYQKSFKIKKELNDKSGMAVSLSNIGYIYMLKKQDYKAMSYYLLALKSAQETDDKLRMALVYSNIGGILQRQGNDTQAFENFRKGLKLSEEIGDVDGVAHYMYNLGTLFLKKGNTDSALYFGNESMKHSQNVGSPTLIRLSAELLKNTYKAKGNSTKALEYFELYFKMNDSINNEETKKATFKQQLSYEYEKKETEAKNEQDKKDVENASAIKRQQILTWSIGIGLLIVIIFSIFLYKRFVLTQKQKHIIEEQKKIVDEKNTEILDSISYAKRLQDAILPPIKIIEQQFPQSFVLFKPKDIVAGDFYWFEQIDGLLLFAAADCTGHGVPGAMVSVVCSNALNRAVKEFKITEPGKILDKVRELVVETFQKSESEVKDGMDISLCSFNKKTNQLKWAGANNPLWIIKNVSSSGPDSYLDENQLIEYKANKQPIGKTDSPNPFTTHSVTLQKDDTIFLFTDGYSDQFGGPNGKKFKYLPFKELLQSIKTRSMGEQLTLLDNKIENWKGSLEQVDDILVIGIKI